MLKEKRDFIKLMIDNGRIKADIWAGKAYIMKQDKSGFMKWVDNHGYWKTRVGTWNIALHEIIAVASGLDVVDKDEKLYINHINGNKKDCSFANLEVLNNSQNNKHAWKLGLKEVAPKRLTKDDVLAVKFLGSLGFLQVDIAEAMNISPTHVNSIMIGHRWANIHLKDYVAITDHIIGDTLNDYVQQGIIFIEKDGSHE